MSSLRKGAIRERITIKIFRYLSLVRFWLFARSVGNCPLSPLVLELRFFHRGRKVRTAAEHCINALRGIFNATEISLSANVVRCSNHHSMLRQHWILTKSDGRSFQLPARFGISRSSLMLPMVASRWTPKSWPKQLPVNLRQALNSFTSSHPPCLPFWMCPSACLEISSSQKMRKSPSHILWYGADSDEGASCISARDFYRLRQEQISGGKNPS